MNVATDGASARTVLVVEDETFIRMLIAEELEEAGYAVLEAGSADDALAMLEHTTAVDLVITDVRMPGTKTGLDVAAWLRANRSQTRIVVMSGYVHEEVATAAAEFDAFVRKPFKPADLLEQARTLLGA